LNAPVESTLSRAISILERLVAFDTESTRSNLALIDYVEDYLRGLGVATVRVPNERGDKAALHALIGPAVDGGVVLSGHTDCVPVEGQAWTSDPFALTRRGDRLYGRGACDMKGFDACCLAMTPDLLAMPLRLPVHILLSYDEEISCEGSLDTIAKLGVDLPRPAACLVGEPTLMQVADGQKSVASYCTHVRGHEAHSAKPMLGVSAIEVATRLMATISAIGEDFARNPDRTARFDPPFATVHVGTVAGGSARNIMAKNCTFRWEFRGLPDMPIRTAYDRFEATAETLRRTTFAAFPDCRIDTLIESETPGLIPDPGSAAERIALALTGRNETIAVSYATEAGQFQKAGIPAVICGPGSIDQAHQPDEFIELAQLDACIAFLRGLAADLSR
jgi:acetylornithine deacetylase